ncbi:MAG: outer membrane protein assembly factor BamD [Myxococcales bacterium]|nr:outer membrane protein assembly factor BamD [Myxococcales bacterium]
MAACVATGPACVRLLVGACGAFAFACSSQTAQPIAVEAESLYQDGLEHLHGGGLLEAEQDFLKLSKLPSYLGLTALARLRLADAQFHQRKFEEAIETYHSFVQRHDGNENVPYALFMVAKAHVEMMPSDFWALPPVHELDLSSVQQARKQLERFVRQHPRSRYVTEALLLRDRCLDVLDAHNHYVIEFYRDAGQWVGVVARLHQAMQEHPARTHTLDNYALLAEAYEHLAWRQRAVDVWRVIGARWPQTSVGSAAAATVTQFEREMARAKARGEASEMPAEPPPTAEVKPEKLTDRELEEG